MTMNASRSHTEPRRRASGRVSALGAALLGLMSCNNGELDRVRGYVEDMGGALGRASRLDASAQPLVDASAPAPAPDLRYIALVKEADSKGCPAATGWSTGPLLRQGPVAALLEGQTLPAPLERFCEYRWGGAQPPADEPKFSELDTARVVRIDADQDVVVPQAPASALQEAELTRSPVALPGPGNLTRPRHLGDDPAVLEVLAGAFRRAAGAAPGTATPTPADVAYVAIVDSVSTAQASTAYSAARPRLRHGLMMAALVRAIRCPHGDASCAAQQYHTQAFPYAGGDPDAQPNGGPLGSQGSLARAMTEALVIWRKDHMPARLILNLSVGWDARYGGALTKDPADHVSLLSGWSADVPAPVQAVHAVAAWAACNQALVIAAAGNNPGAPCEHTGAMAPGLWERYPAPTRQECTSLFGAETFAYYDDPEGKRGAGSLVYAAGGLTYDDQPIPNARAGGMPTRAMPSMQAVASAGSGYTGSWTGTSIATASLSAVAARLWSHSSGQPLSPHEIMRLIDRTGVGLPMSASLLPSGQGAQAVRRISAQRAFAGLCPGCANPYVSQGPSDALALIDQSFTGTQVLGSRVPINAQLVALPCAATELECGPAGPRTVVRCASPTLAAAPVSPDAGAPWVRPQPDTPICPVCPVKDKKLTLSLNPDHAAGAVTISRPTLSFSLASVGDVDVTLEEVTVGSTPVDVDLQRFRVALPTGAPTLLGDLLEAEGVRAGELRFIVPDEAGAPAELVSAVTVHS